MNFLVFTTAVMEGRSFVDLESIACVKGFITMRVGIKSGERKTKIDGCEWRSRKGNGGWKAHVQRGFYGSGVLCEK